MTYVPDCSSNDSAPNLPASNPPASPVALSKGHTGPTFSGFPAPVRQGTTRWQRWLPRVVAVVALCAFGGALVWRSSPNRSVAPLPPGATPPAVAPTTPDQIRTDWAEQPGPAGPAADAANVLPAELAGDADPAAAAPSYRSRMLGALGVLVDQQAEVFGDADSGLRRELDGGLAVADDILADARLANRRALMNANRQVRLAERSPALLIILVPGLSRESLGCYHTASGATSSPSPVIDRLAANGLRSNGFGPNDARRSKHAAGSSSASDGARSAEPASEPFEPLERLPRLLWQSGYETRLIGELDTTPPAEPAWWESGFGWSPARVGDAHTGWPFPTVVASNGQPLRIANNEIPSQRSFSEVLVDEATSIARNANRAATGLNRPTALVVRTPLAWWKAIDKSSSLSPSDNDEQSGPPAFDSGAVRQLDRFVEQLLANFRPKKAPSTLVMLVGVPRAAAANDAKSDVRSHDLGPLVIHWPGKVPAGLRTVALHGESELLRTVADIIQSTRR